MIILNKTVIFILCLHYSNCISTFGIDLGCDIIKIGIAKPSVKIAIAVDEFGRKIISSAIYIKNNMMIFGESALDRMSSDPTNVYLHIPCLLGKGLQDNRVQDYLKQFPYYNIKEDPSSHSLYFTNKRNETYSVDELLSYILDNCVKLANQSIEKMYPTRYKPDFDSRTVVITIPSVYKQKEKVLLLRICKFINVSVLQLLESNNAAYLAMVSLYLKKLPEMGTYGIIDIGAEHIQMTIADVKRVKAIFRSYEYETSNITILSSSFQTDIGVNKVLHKMQDFFIKKFTLKRPNLNFKDPLLIAKLYMGCRKLLRHLCSSKNTIVKIKKWFSEFDYKLSMNNSVFLNIIETTLNGIKEVIKTSFRNLQGFWIIPKGVAVIGGGRFLPFVENTIKQTLKKTPYLKVLDSFLSVAWGAVYRATNIAPGIFNFPIIIPEKNFKFVKVHIKINNLHKEKEMVFKFHDQKFISSLLFRELKHNFNFSVYYGPNAVRSNEASPVNIIEPILLHNIVVSNLEEILHEMTSLNKESKNLAYKFKGVKIVYSFDIHSVIHIESIAAVFVKRSRVNIATLENVEDLINSTHKLYINDKKLELLNLKLNYTIIQPYPSKTKDKWNQMMHRIHYNKLKSKEHFEREAVKNELEYYISDIKRKFNEKDYIICTSEIERKLIWSFLEDTTRWMKDVQSKNILINEYFHKFDHLINLTVKIDLRVHELVNRPILLNKLKLLLDNTQLFIMNMFVTSASGTMSKGLFTKNETKELRFLNKEIRKWYNDFNDQFKPLLPHEDPPILSDKIIEKIVILETDHRRLLALMEKRKDPNENDNNNSGNTLIENNSEKNDTSSGNNVIKKSSMKDTCNADDSDTCKKQDNKTDAKSHNSLPKDNNETYSPETGVSNEINETKKYCLRQNKDKKDEEISTENCN